MTTVTFEQTSTNNGQVFLKLSSQDLPAGEFSFAISFTYGGGPTQFSALTFAGTASPNVVAASDNSSGSVSVTGPVSPTAATFATFVFDVSGAGVFNADVASFTINGVTPVFVDPPALAYNIPPLAETLSIQADAAAVGVFNPFTTSFFTADTVFKAALHGSVGISSSPFNFSQTKWTYTPDAGFYGLDTFTLKATNAFQAQEKIVVLNVSPVGTAGNDVFHSSAANYTVDGCAGIDRIVYAGKSSDFSIVKAAGGFSVADMTGLEGTNTLANFERLKFSDTAFALDIDGNGGQAYRIYQAAFDRAPDLAGLGFWIKALDSGVTLTAVADGFVHSAEFQAIYGANTPNLELVTKFYENILHRAPEQAGLDFWVGVLDSNRASHAAVLAGISESSENQLGLIGVIGNGFPYTEYL